MYAVIETGGKQYRVEVGTELEVELLDVEPGQSITLERVLLVADDGSASIGQPIVEDAAVEAEVVGRERGDKVVSFKYRPKARRRVKKGHRQELTVLRIADIRLGGKSAAASVEQAESRKQTERQRLQEAAARQAAEDAALAAKLAVGTAPEEAPAEAPAPKRTRAKVEAPKPVADATAGATETPEPEAAAAATPAPKRTRAKAAAEPADDATPAGAAEATPAEPADAAGTPDATPKRSRTKKDE